MHTGTRVALFGVGGIAMGIIFLLLIVGACCAGVMYYLFRTHAVTHDPSVKTNFVVGRSYELQQDAELLSVRDSDGKKFNFINPIDPTNPHPVVVKGTTFRFDKIMRAENFEIGASTYPVMTITNGPYKDMEVQVTGITHCNEKDGEVMINTDFLK